jgi:hypothetical protein
MPACLPAWVVEMVWAVSRIADLVCRFRLGFGVVYVLRHFLLCDRLFVLGRFETLTRVVVV